MNRSIMHRFASLTSAALLVSSLPLAAETAVPGLMTYQAFVTDDANQPLAPAAPANYEVIFRIYDSATGNTVIWSEKQTVSIFQGNFSVLLGNGQVVGAEPKPEDLGAIFTAKERYMGITVGENAEFSPRQRILPNAYAYRAKVAESVGGVISLDGTSTSLSGALNVDGHTNLDGFRSDGDADINGALDVDGYTHLDGFTSDGSSIVNAPLAVNGLLTSGAFAASHPQAEVNIRATRALEDEFRPAFRIQMAAGHPAVTVGKRPNNNQYYFGLGAGVDAVFNDNLDVYGYTFLEGGFRSDGDADINGALDVDHWTNLDGFRSDGHGDIRGNLSLTGDADFNGRLDVDGYTHLDGFTSDGSSIVNAPLAVNGLLTSGAFAASHPQAEVNIRASQAAEDEPRPAFRIQRASGHAAVTVVQHPLQQKYIFELGNGVDAYKPLGGAWASSSDKRLKKNIQDLDGALDKLLKLRSVTYEYKDPKHRYYVAGKQTGFIAQEVEEVFPEWVMPLPFGPDKDEPNLKGISVTGFESLAVQALRELRAEKDEQIEALKEANSALETRLAKLEALLEKPVSGFKPVSGSIKESN